MRIAIYVVVLVALLQVAHCADYSKYNQRYAPPARRCIAALEDLVVCILINTHWRRECPQLPFTPTHCMRQLLANHAWVYVCTRWCYDDTWETVPTPSDTDGQLLT